MSGEAHVQEAWDKVMGVIIGLVVTACGKECGIHGVPALSCCSTTIVAPFIRVPKVTAICWSTCHVLAITSFQLRSSINRLSFLPWCYNTIANSHRLCAKLWNHHFGGWEHIIMPFFAQHKGHDAFFLQFTCKLQRVIILQSLPHWGQSLGPPSCVLLHLFHWFGWLRWDIIEAEAWLKCDSG